MKKVNSSVILVLENSWISSESLDKVGLSMKAWSTLTYYSVFQTPSLLTQKELIVSEKDFFLWTFIRTATQRLNFVGATIAFWSSLHEFSGSQITARSARCKLSLYQTAIHSSVVTHKQDHFWYMGYTTSTL